MSVQSEKKTIDGVLLLDKSIGITSNRALQDLKRLFKAKKAGHTGSLDPLATGMLPICFGEATKFSQMLLDADKSYDTTAKLGVITDSGDAEGNVIERREVGEITEEKLEKVLDTFRGKILQIPSMFSALKKEGKPLYKLARQGIQVQREARPITIYELKLISFTDDQIKLSVKASKGTYIRSLVEDIGIALGCGAHVTELRRTSVSGFTQEKMVKFEILQKIVEEKNEASLKDFLLPVDVLLQEMPSIQLSEQDTLSLQKGQKVKLKNREADTEPAEFRLYDHQNQFLGIGILVEDHWIQPKRLLKFTD